MAWVDILIRWRWAVLAATTAVVLGWEGARANTPQDFFYHLFFWLFIGVVGLLVWSAMKAMGRWI